MPMAVTVASIAVAIGVQRRGGADGRSCTRHGGRAALAAIMHPLHRPVLEWYADHARELPWRGPAATPWAVMVSEFMLQQTPVTRVLPVFDAWLERWPSPGALAGAPSGEAVRAWGRLGYPRRALRLHAAATAIMDSHGGEVPESYADLIALPGVGDYTASAIASFAFGARHPVLDTNVRRVFARTVGGTQFPAASVTRAERDVAESLLPADEAATWAVAVMELGALICTASTPRCDSCPVSDLCAWNTAGRPAYDGPPRRSQSWAGTDRQARGRLMAVLRDEDGPVSRGRLDAAWSDVRQRERALASLLADGLVVELPGLDATRPVRLLPPHLTPRRRKLAQRNRRDVANLRRLGGIVRRPAVGQSPLAMSTGPSVSSGPPTGSSGRASGRTPLGLPLKLNCASAPSPSTSTSTIWPGPTSP